MQITLNDDFNLYKIAFSGQCFRVRQLNDYTYRFITGNHIVDIEDVSGNSAVDAEALSDNPVHDIKTQTPPIHNDSQGDNSIHFNVSCDLEEWTTIWTDYFDLATNYKSLRESIPDKDFYLKKASNIGKGIRILRQDKFEMLISYIISQRKSIPAIKSSVEKICRKYGTPIINALDEVTSDEMEYAFPSPEQLSVATEEELQQCGLGYRVPYILDATKRVLNGTLNLEQLDSLPDVELLSALKTVYGVGDKVANCVSLFAYHRIGMAPIDTWINKVITEVYNGNNPFINYPKNAGIMQQYMFYASQHEKYIK